MSFLPAVLRLLIDNMSCPIHFLLVRLLRNVNVKPFQTLQLFFANHRLQQFCFVLQMRFDRRLHASVSSNKCRHDSYRKHIEQKIGCSKIASS